MKKRLYFLLALVISIVTTTSVNAAAPNQIRITHHESDLYSVTANPNGGTIAAYIVGESKSSALSFKTSATETYITLPNGNFYVWVKNTAGEYSEGVPISVTQSCSNDKATNVTGDGKYSRCYLRYNDGTEVASVNLPDVTCAAGYNISPGYSTLVGNDCGKKNVSITGLRYRYCKKTYSYRCEKVSTGGTTTPSSGGSGSTTTQTGNAKLSSLSISTGSLTPNFSSNTYTYSATTSESSVRIDASLMSSSASFVTGYGPRSVNLNYGTNNIQIKAMDGNTPSTYTIKIKRTDGRSSVNTLSSLSVSKGSLSPAFNEYTTTYNVNVASDVDSVDISAAVKDGKSSFLENYGPRSVVVNAGTTRTTLKVKSETGNIRTYTLIFNKEGSSEAQTPVTSYNPLLSSLEVSEGKIEFDPNTFDYNLSVAYDVTNIAVKAFAQNPDDEVVVTGGDNLLSDELNEIDVVVTSKDKTVSNTYTIYVTRKEEDLPVSSNSLLQDLQIDGYKIKFDAKTNEYSITLAEGATQLSITAVPSDSTSIITIEGNENLTAGSQVKIRVTAEDGSYTDYFVKIKGVGRKGNVVLTVIVVILIILVIAYLVLRAMGYKIYFNLDAVKDKVTRIFKRD